jgi:hypothetical protein
MARRERSKRIGPGATPTRPSFYGRSWAAAAMWHDLPAGANLPVRRPTKGLASAQICNIVYVISCM